MLVTGWSRRDRARGRVIARHAPIELAHWSGGHGTSFKTIKDARTETVGSEGAFLPRRERRKWEIHMRDSKIDFDKCPHPIAVGARARLLTSVRALAPCARPNSRPASSGHMATAAHVTRLTEPFDPVPCSHANSLHAARPNFLSAAASGKRHEHGSAAR